MVPSHWLSFLALSFIQIQIQKKKSCEKNCWNLFLGGQLRLWLAPRLQPFISPRWDFWGILISWDLWLESDSHRREAQVSASIISSTEKVATIQLNLLVKGWPRIDHITSQLKWLVKTWGWALNLYKLTRPSWCSLPWWHYAILDPSQWFIPMEFKGTMIFYCTG